jgi:hypothetical protein
MIARNIPLVVLIAVLGLLLRPSNSEPSTDAEADEVRSETEGGSEEMQMPLPAAPDLHREAA